MLGLTGCNIGKDLFARWNTSSVEEYELTYEVEGEGIILGDFFQIVVRGESGTEVFAEAFDDWVFLEWSDGYTEPLRVDMNVKSNITVKAIFVPMMADEGEGDGEFEDEPITAPSEGDLSLK